jgi:hypothetical protein
MKQARHFRVELTSFYGKPIEANITIDRYGDFGIDNIVINGNFYSGKQIRTALREQILLNYIQKFVDLDAWVDEESNDTEDNNFTY